MRVFALFACLCLALLAFITTAHATDVVQSWAQTYQISGGESPDIFTVDSKGSIYIASYEPYSLIGNWWVIRKLNSLGQFQWSQTFYANGIPNDMAADANGNLFITSYTSLASTNQALTIKLNSNGDLGWIREFSGGVGLSLHLDSSGNVYVGGSWSNGGAYEMLLLEYSSAGEILNVVEQPGIEPGTSLFLPNGNLAMTGLDPNNNSPIMAVFSSSGTLLFSTATTNTTTDNYTYLMTGDSSSNVYLVVNDNHDNDASFSYGIYCYAHDGEPTWSSMGNTGFATLISASDSNHAYVHVSTGSSMFADEGFKAGGVRFMNVQSNYGLIAADGVKGLVGVTENATAYTYGEINQDLQTIWSQTYSGTEPEGSLGLKVFNSTVYSLNQTALNGVFATNFIKFVQGVGMTAVTPTASSIQGGKPVNLTVQLNDVTPAAGLAVYFVSSSSALGLPSSLVIPSGKSSLLVTALTDPVDVATPVSIAAEVNGGIRTTTVTLTPAVLSTVTFPGGANASVKGGQSITGTITLSGPTALLSHTVTLASNSTKATVPASVNVLPGDSTATFVVKTTAVTANTTVTITAKMAGGTVTGKFTITP